MVWIVGARRSTTRKHKLVERGPSKYTLTVLKRLEKLAASPVLHDRMLQRQLAAAGRLLAAGKLSAYTRHPATIGIIASPEVALRTVAAFIERNLDWTDIEIRSKGKAFFARWLREVLADTANGIGYTGKYEDIIQHLMWRAKKEFGWAEW